MNLGFLMNNSFSIPLNIPLNFLFIVQIEVPWKLEFRVRFYPPNIDEFKDDLTRYFFCLQLRQDIISGQLPCSHHTYVILGAYVVQSDAGDYDPNTHIGTDYIANIPFAPQHLQTSKMLQQIVELHKLHKGQTLVQADRGFLENARRLSLYGVEFHRAKTNTGESVCLGVYHGGILLYHVLIPLFCLFFQMTNLAARLRDTPGPQRPNLTTAFSMRKYHFPSKTFDAYSRQPSSEWITRQQPPIKRVQAQRKPPNYSKYFSFK
ncbi:unnamed protein product [Trichobilharzia regenti]|nr:unnamed protein product [Trichobilharzia regenti]